MSATAHGFQAVLGRRGRRSSRPRDRDDLSGKGPDLTTFSGALIGANGSDWSSLAGDSGHKQLSLLAGRVVSAIRKDSDWKRDAGLAQLKEAIDALTNVLRQLDPDERQRSELVRRWLAYLTAMHAVLERAVSDD